MLIFILRSDDTYCVCEGQIMPCKLKSYFQGVTRINLIWMTYSKKKKKNLKLDELLLLVWTNNFLKIVRIFI